jgi:Tetracyclin repressor-like, C-terminal domain
LPRSTNFEVCAGTFETLIAGVGRCIESGHFSPADPAALATELWAAGHGLVTLRLSGALPAEPAAATLAGLLTHLLGAFGADPGRAGAAVERAACALGRPD